jgi:hypothetical protein
MNILCKDKLFQMLDNKIRSRELASRIRRFHIATSTQSSRSTNSIDTKTTRSTPGCLNGPSPLRRGGATPLLPAAS